MSNVVTYTVWSSSSPRNSIKIEAENHVTAALDFVQRKTSSPDESSPDEVIFVVDPNEDRTGRMFKRQALQHAIDEKPDGIDRVIHAAMTAPIVTDVDIESSRKILARHLDPEPLVDSTPALEPATTHFDPDAPRPYTWTMLVTVSVCEMVVADGFDPFDLERDLSPHDMLDHIVGNVDAWDEKHVEIESVQPIAIPDRSHIRRAQGYREADDVSERDRKIIAETIRRVVDEATLNGVDIGDRLRDFCDAMESDADGADVQTAIDSIYTVEHGE
jgi:hypothetical protein